MQGNKEIEVFAYPQQLYQDSQQYRRRLTIEQFKGIDAKRIKRQFKVLQSAEIVNYNQVAHLSDRQKDRYGNVHAYKHNRVTVGSNVDNFYINASLMRSVDDEIQHYAIFAQAPLENVFDNFWYACYHYKIRRIIMLCALEDPYRGRQAEKYWPEVNKTVKYTHLELKVTNVEQKTQGDYVRSVMLMDGPEGGRQLEHIHWTGWGDMRKPLGEHSEAIIKELVEGCLKLKEQMFLLHCSAGIGRTGTLGALIEAVRCARGKERRLSVFEVVDYMRRQRWGCVQTFEQYSFIYQMLKKML